MVYDRDCDHFWNSSLHYNPNTWLFLHIKLLMLANWLRSSIVYKMLCIFVMIWMLQAVQQLENINFRTSIIIQLRIAVQQNVWACLFCLCVLRFLIFNPKEIYLIIYLLIVKDDIITYGCDCCNDLTHGYYY